jgi:hypothetical protein
LLSFAQACIQIAKSSPEQPTDANGTEFFVLDGSNFLVGIEGVNNGLQVLDEEDQQQLREEWRQEKLAE